MKLFSKAIIFILAIFSIGNFNILQASYMDEILDAQTGVEDLELSLAKLNKQNLKTPKYLRMQNGLARIDNIIKRAIINNYENGNYGYYQTQAIIKNYNNFIYYANELFYYVKQKELYPSYSPIDTQILKNYKSMIIYYKKVKILSSKKDAN